MLSDVPQWIAIYTSSRHEKQVALRLAEIGVESYLPLRRVRRHWSDRVKIVEEPLIKSYLFARIRNVDLDRVRAVTGVAWIVSFGKVVATIPDDQIETMRRFVDSEKEIAVYETSCLREGATVEIIEGVLQGCRGVIISGCKEGNFAIRIDALCVSMVAEIDQNLLRVCRGVKKDKGIFHKQEA